MMKIDEKFKPFKNYDFFSRWNEGNIMLREIAQHRSNIVPIFCVKPKIIYFKSRR